MNKYLESRALLGCRVTITLLDSNEEKARDAMSRAFLECERIEASYSRFIEGNELAELNAHLNEWVPVGAELLSLIQEGERLKALSEGAFDLTVHSILEGWGYDAQYTLREGTAGQTGQIEIADGKIKTSARIDLGGLGKGYAVDRMISLLSEHENVCIDAGGDIFARGLGEGARPWRMIFEHPSDLNKGIGYVDVDSFAVAASSPARRKWRDHHHLVDPRRAEPAQKMRAVYTQAKTTLWADACSTALFVLGFEEAKEKIPNLDLEAMLVGPTGAIYRSDGFRGKLFI